jgi:hypothetical protein
MKKLSLVLVLVVGTSMGISAAEFNSSAIPSKASDSTQYSNGKMCGQMAGKACCMGQGAAMAGHEWGGMRGHGFGPMFQNRMGWGMNGVGMHPRLMMMHHRLFHLALLAILSANILLTVLVGLDMTKRAKFNGLWIPILLIAGIPGSAVYALFRIGDSIADVKRT